jgi:hypothetical protein
MDRFDDLIFRSKYDRGAKEMQQNTTTVVKNGPLGHQGIYVISKGVHVKGRRGTC